MTHISATSQITPTTGNQPEGHRLMKTRMEAVLLKRFGSDEPIPPVNEDAVSLRILAPGTALPPQRYRILSDDDGHDYIVEVEREVEFYDTLEEQADMGEFRSIGGSPTLVSFTDPVID
jgi:hypothetical protein